MQTYGPAIVSAPSALRHTLRAFSCTICGKILPLLLTPQFACLSRSVLDCTRALVTVSCSALWYDKSNLRKASNLSECLPWTTLVTPGAKITGKVDHVAPLSTCTASHVHHGARLLFKGERTWGLEDSRTSRHSALALTKSDGRQASWACVCVSAEYVTKL